MKYNFSIFAPFLLEAVEASLSYFFENWLVANFNKSEKQLAFYFQYTPRPISPWSSKSSALKTNSSPLIFSVPVDCEFKLNGNLMSGPVVFDEAIGIAGLVAALVKSLKFRPVGFLKLGWDKLIVRQDRFSCWTGDIIDEGIRPPPEINNSKIS